VKEPDQVANVVTSHTIALQLFDLLKFEVLVRPLAKYHRLSFLLRWATQLACEKPGFKYRLLTSVKWNGLEIRFDQQGLPAPVRMNTSITPLTGTLRINVSDTLPMA